MFEKFIKDLKELNLKSNTNIIEKQRNKLLLVKNEIGTGNIHNILTLCNKYNYCLSEFRTQHLLPSDFYLFHHNINPEWINNYIDKDKPSIIIVNREGENENITDIINRMIYKRKIKEKYIKGNFLFIDYSTIKEKGR